MQSSPRSPPARVRYPGGVGGAKYMPAKMCSQKYYARFYQDPYGVIKIVGLRRHKLSSKTSTCGKQRTRRCLLQNALKFEQQKVRWHMGGPRANKDPEILKTRGRGGGTQQIFTQIFLPLENSSPKNVPPTGTGRAVARERLVAGVGECRTPPHLEHTMVVPSCEAYPPSIVPPCVTFRLVVGSLQSPGQSPVLPFACCVGVLLSVSRCSRCSCSCRFRVRGAQWLVCRGCAGCGMLCRLCVRGAQ